ncbi:MAG: tetratricopeptide repeat protein [Candidatus Helarchaeota archaeon]
MRFEFEKQMKIYADLISDAEKYEQNYRFEQAFKIYLNAEKIVKKFGSKLEIGKFFCRKGRILAKKHDLKGALNAFKESLKFLKKGNAMPSQISMVKNAIGDAYKINRMVNDALKSYKEALKILKDEKERVLYTHSHLIGKILTAIATTLLNISEMQLVLNNLESSLENCQESLKIALDLKKPSLLLKSRMEIARIYLKIGNIEKAINHLKESLDIAKREENPLYLLELFFETANIYYAQKNYSFALKFLKKALKISETIGNRQKKIIILDKIGLIYLNRNRKKKAEAFFQMSYEIASELKQFHFEHILYHKGILSYLNGDFDKSYEILKEAIKFAEKSNSKEILVSGLLKIGDILKAHTNYDDAIYYYKKSLEYSIKIEKYLKINNRIGLAYLLSGDLQNANEYLLKSYKILRVLILCEKNDEIKQKLLNEFNELFENLFAITCKLFEKTNDFKLIETGISYIEYWKIQKNDKLSYKLDDLGLHSIVNSHNDIIKKVTEWKQLMSEYLIMKKNQSTKIKLRKKIEEKQNVILQLEENLWNQNNSIPIRFPSSELKIISELFKTFENHSDPWIILNIIFVKSLNTLYLLIIDMYYKKVSIISKILPKKFPKLIINKIKQLNSSKIKENPIKFEKIQNSITNSLEKLIPKTLIEQLIKQKYKTLIIIPHAFLINLPWDRMKFRKQFLKDFLNINISFSLNQILLQNSVCNTNMQTNIK